jgi:hypothetical protein
MWDAGFDISFWDCPTKGGMGGHPRNGVVVKFDHGIDGCLIICYQTV